MTADPPADWLGPPAPESTRLPVAVRAHTTRDRRKQQSFPRSTASGAVLVFDTETTVDHVQALTFGCWRYYRPRRRGGPPILAEEGLFYADDLPDIDLAGLAVLRAHAARATTIATSGTLRLLSRAEFVNQVFYPAAYESRATVVGFNLPFDLSRIAIAAAEGRGRNLRGFSFTLAAGNAAKGHTERRHVPRVLVKHLDSHAAFIHFGRPFEATQRWDGEFIDLRTLTFALTGRGHSLQSACEAFGLPGKDDPGEHGRITPAYVDYCRTDVQRTAELHQACVAELDALDLPIEPRQAFSPASLAKAVLTALGVTPHSERKNPLSPQVQGWFMSAFFGGRAECRIRKTEVPVTLVDFTSMYPTVFALMKLWDHCKAEEIGTEDATDEVRVFLEQVTLESMFDQQSWPKLVGIALVRPEGDVLPVRAQYDPDKTTWNIGVNHLTSATPLWYTLADLVASKLLTGKAPVIERAIRLTRAGTLPTLKPWTMPGGKSLDPTADAPWPAMVEERQRIRRDADLPAAERDRIALFLKITANSGGYGIYAEYNRQDLPTGKASNVQVHSHSDDPTLASVTAPEDPGKHSCPPLAAVITGAARLMLAVLERSVTDLGGAWAFADTDSMAVVTTPERELIPCEDGPAIDTEGRPYVRSLSDSDLEGVRARFEALNPYDRDAIPGTVLKNELSSYCYAVAAKRYALYRRDPDGTARLVPPSEHEPCSHGLGHLLNPTDADSDDAHWITQFWEHHLNNDWDHASSWLDRPALGNVAVTAPAVHRALTAFNRGRPYRDQIKPFGFLIHAPSAREEGGGRLVSPYSNDPRQWLRQPWIDLKLPGTMPRMTTDPAQPSRRLVGTYLQLAETYFHHREMKSATSGRPCARMTRGLLQRRHIEVSAISLIGKEANDLEDRSFGFQDDITKQTVAEYDAPSGLDDETLQRLRHIGSTELARRTGRSARRIRDVLESRSVARRMMASALAAAAALGPIPQSGIDLASHAAG